MEKKLLFLEHNDPEFTYAFNHFPDKTMHNPMYHESLQYMGTEISPNGNIEHCFRHRAIPGTNERKYWHFKASTTFTERIQKGEYTSKIF